MALPVKFALSLAASGMIISVLAPAVAQAAPQAPSFTFCNISSVQEYASFPYHGHAVTAIQNPGACTSVNLSGFTSDEAVVYRQINGVWPAVGTCYFNDNQSTLYSI